MSIKLSNKHGINPSVETCWLCGKSIEVVLFGRLKQDKKAPIKVTSRIPCNECQKFQKQGIILISVKNNTPINNPYRTGAFVVVKEDYIHRIMKTGKAKDKIISNRYAFVPDTTWDSLGLPRSSDNP